MKCYFILFIFITTKVNAQQKISWAYINIYAFQLPKNISLENIKATVIYKDKPLVSKKRRIGKTYINIQPTFIKVDSMAALSIYKALPISLPSQTFIWLVDDDMAIEMALYPNRYKVKISTTPNTNTNWLLPATFDVLSDNIINVAYLQCLNTAAFQQLLLQKINTLSIPTK
ncbi:hypothetical protein ACFOWM_07645 [Ferruginibacter yonginensis]|uniref:Uncharacterized protein n=1 Tax=Ferruginibacter yonginensis TaxID=1310416 RepID=A0ABV8QR66_9BACT